MPTSTVAFSTVSAVIITFATTDADRLRFLVTLDAPAPVALDYGEQTYTSTQATRRHVFDLPAPVGSPVSYLVKSGPHAPRSKVSGGRIESVCGSAPSFAFVGDGGPGEGPRRQLWSQFEGRLPIVLAANPSQWMASVLAEPALSLRSPVLWAGAANALPSMFPRDEIRDGFDLPAHVYHLRCGPVLLWMLDASLGFSDDGAQAGFMRKTSQEPGVRYRLAVMNHGPASSGPRGGHAEGTAFAPLARTLDVDLVVSGQDGLYERLFVDGRPVIVTGASGAHVERRQRWLPNSEALVSTPHWVDVTVTASGAYSLQAFGLEGTLLDVFRGSKDRPPAVEAHAYAPLMWLLSALGVLFGTLFVVALRLLRPSGGSR